MPKLNTISVEILPALRSTPSSIVTSAKVFTADGALAFYGSAAVVCWMGVFVL